MVEFCVVWFIAFVGWKQGSCELLGNDDTSQYTFERKANVNKRDAQSDATCEAILEKIRLDGLSTATEHDFQTSSTSIAGAQLQTTPAAEADGWVYYKATNMCYKIFDDYSNFDEAEKNCNGYDGHLASIHSMEHNQFLLALDPNMDEDDADLWIGLKIEGQCELHWIDGSDLDFQNWVQIQPDCTTKSTLMMSSGQWYTENGHHGNPFVCETESTIYCPQHPLSIAVQDVGIFYLSSAGTPHRLSRKALHCSITVNGAAQVSDPYIMIGGSCELLGNDDTSQYTFERKANVNKRDAQSDATCEAILEKIRLDGLSTATEHDFQTSSTSIAGAQLQTTPAAEADGWVYYKATNMCYKV
ncbi:hypothetical protein RB195_008435 [Necator americanus]|uniref:C-type lectin domain-containing protein n=1 Tax=Necator americanus TaxID=51031 RepID=A0ABR1CQI9_NECAM